MTENKPPRDRRQGSMIVRVVCGIYLLYLSVELFLSLWRGEITDPKMKIIMGVAIVVFAAVGILLLAVQLREMKRDAEAASQVDAEQIRREMAQDLGIGHVEPEEDNPFEALEEDSSESDDCKKSG